MTERYCEGERFADLSFTEETFEDCDFTDCVFVDCSFTKCELDHTRRPGDVADPWYTGDFEATWQDVLEGCTALLEELR